MPFAADTAVWCMVLFDLRQSILTVHSIRMLAAALQIFEGNACLLTGS